MVRVPAISTPPLVTLKVLSESDVGATGRFSSATTMASGGTTAPSSGTSLATSNSTAGRVWTVVVAFSVPTSTLAPENTTPVVGPGSCAVRTSDGVPPVTS